jgi:hypothetical protein
LITGWNTLKLNGLKQKMMFVLRAGWVGTRPLRPPFHFSVSVQTYSIKDKTESKGFWRPVSMAQVTLTIKVFLKILKSTELQLKHPSKLLWSVLQTTTLVMHSPHPKLVGRPLPVPKYFQIWRINMMKLLHRWMTEQKRERLKCPK